MNKTHTPLRLALIGALCLLVGVAATVKFSALSTTATVDDADYFPVIHSATNYTITVNALALNLATNTALATNFLPALRINVVTGAGGALTNFTLVATNSENVIGVKTNVSVRAIMGTDPNLVYYWTLIATNLSGADWGLEFSPRTNSFRFQGTGGTNAPTTLTNNTAFVANGRSQGTNTRVSYTYFAAP